MDRRRMLDDPVTKQGPVLHQAKHRVVPPVAIRLFGEGILASSAKFSARRICRNWAYGGKYVAASAMVTMIVLAASTWLSAWLLAVWLMVPQSAAAKSRLAAHPPSAARSTGPAQQLAVKVPLPQPRPAEAPQREIVKGDGKPSEANDRRTGDMARSGGGKDAVEPVPEPSACRLALTGEVAIAPSIPPIRGPGACGGEDLVRLEAVLLPDRRRVALTPAATMRCTMATAVVNWVRDDVAPLVNALGSEITALDNFDSYQCRGRNGKSGGPLSEHAKANAIDVHGFKLADGRMIELTDRTQPRDFREAILHSACTRFPTVLGPDSDWYHEDHIHLDLIERRSNYRICQWDVLDPLPKVAPLIPEARPEEAPPRVVAEAKGSKVEPQAAAVPANGHKQVESTANVRRSKEQESETKSPQQKAAVSEAGSGEQVADRNTASDKPPGRPIIGKADGSTANVAADEKSSSGKSARKSTTRKASADKPAPRKRRHGRHLWNPFEALF
jgi:hypothetical protein